MMFAFGRSFIGYRCRSGPNDEQQLITLLKSGKPRPSGAWLSVVFWARVSLGDQLRPGFRLAIATMLGRDFSPFLPEILEKLFLDIPPRHITRMFRVAFINLTFSFGIGFAMLRIFRRDFPQLMHKHFLPLGQIIARRDVLPDPWPGTVTEMSDQR